MTKILILHVEAGYGHRKVAEALAEEFQSQRDPELYVEVLDALKKTNRSFENFYTRFYYSTVRWVPWLWSFFYFLTDWPFLYLLIRPIRSAGNQFYSKPLQAYLEKEKFDFIIFTHFFPAEVCATLKRK